MEWSLVLAVALPVGVGALSGYLTRNQNRSEWYLSLKKPSWNPPGYVFGPVWTTLYILMGVASWLVWKSKAREPLVLYGVQLALNFAWSLLFFNAQSLSWALIDIVALLGVLAATVASFWRVSHLAGYLMMPYLAWVSFATVLTLNLTMTNPPKKCAQ